MANEQLLKDIAKIYGQDAVANLNTTPTQTTQTQSPKMKKEDILNIYNSFANPSNSTTSQEIPQLQPNTLPDTNILRNNLLDRNSGRTDGETKALEDYLMGVENLKEQTYKQNYNSTIDDLKNQLADTNAQRTEGETKAIEEYLSGLQGLQSEIDRVNAPKNVKKNVLNNTVNSKKENIKKEDTVKDEQKARIEALKEKYGAQAKAQNDSLSAHGYSLSPNEQRDYDRAQEAIKNAQAKLVSQQKEVLANGQNQVNNGGELKVSTLTKNPTKTKLNLTSPTADNSNVEGGGSGASRHFGENAKAGNMEIYANTDNSDLTRKDKKEIKQAYKELKKYGIEQNTENQRKEWQNALASGEVDPQYASNVEKAYFNTSKEGAAYSGIAHLGDAFAKPITAVASAIEKANGNNTDWQEANKNRQVVADELANQHPVASLVGDLAGTSVLYGPASQLAETIGITSPIGKLAFDQAIDNIIQTGSEVASRYSLGKYDGADGKKQLAKDIAVDNAMNLAGNLLGMGVENLMNKNTIPYVGDTVTKNNEVADDVIENAIKQTDDAVQNVESLGKQIPNTSDVADLVPNQADRITGDNFLETFQNEAKNVDNKVMPASIDDGKKTLNIPVVEETPTQNVVNDIPNLEDALNVKKRHPNTPLTNVDAETQKADIRSMLDGIDMDDTTRAEVSKQLDEVDTILDDFNNAQTKDEVISVMDRLENAYKNIDNTMKGKATVSELVDSGNLDAKKQLANAIKGNVIRLSDNSRGEFTDSTMKELNNILFNGKGSGRFSMSTGTPIDSVFGEIDDATGKAISSFMMQNGIDPNVSENQAKGIIEYAKSLKASDNALKQTQEVGSRELLGDTFSDMIDKAGKRGIDIDANELNKRWKLSKLGSNSMYKIDSDEAINDMTKGIYDYVSVPEKETIKEASQRIAKDSEGALKEVMDKSDDAFTSVDVDTSMMLLNDLKKQRANALDLGDTATADLLTTKMDSLKRRMRQAATNAGQTTQAWSKWSRDAEGILFKADSLAEKNYEDIISNNPKLKQSADEISKYIHDELNNLRGSDLWNELVNAPNSDYNALTNKVKEIMDSAIKKVNNKTINKNLDESAVNSLAEQIALELKQGEDIENVFENLERIGVTGFTGIDPSVEDEVRSLLESVENLGFNSKERVEAENKAYSILANAVNLHGSFGDKVNSWRYFSMLSNPKTHIRNTLGNTLFGGMTNIKDSVGALIESGVDKVSKNGIDRTKSILNPFSNADRELYKTSRANADDIYRLLVDGNKYISAGQGIDANKDIFKNKVLNNIIGLNSDLLSKEDEFALYNKYASSLSQYIKANGGDTKVFDLAKDYDNVFKQLESAKLDGNEELISTLTDRLDELKPYKEFLEEAQSHAIDEAKKATFHQMSETADKLSELSRNLLNSTDESTGKRLAKKTAGAVIEGTIPFKKTPINILKSAAAYSPLELTTVLGDIPKVAKGTMKASEMIDDIAKGLTGTAMLLGGMQLAKAGLLNASDTSNGEQAYSLRLGDGTYTIDGFAPASIPLLIGAQIYQTKNQLANGEELGFEDIANALSTIADPLVETTMLSGLSEVLNVNKYNNDESESSPILNMASAAGMDYATQFVPTELGNIARTVDDTRRSSYTGEKGFLENLGKKTLNKTENRIPFLSKTNEPYLDNWGQEQKNAFSDNVIPSLLYQHLSPGYYQKTDNSDRAVELRRLAEATGDTKVTNEGVKTSVTVNKEKIKLSPEQLTQYGKSAGTVKGDLVDAFMKSEAYQNMDDDQRAKVIDSLYDLGNKVGLQETFPEYSSSDALLKSYNINDIDGAVSKAITSAETSTTNNEISDLGVPVNEATKKAYAEGDQETLDSWKNIQEEINNAGYDMNATKDLIEKKSEMSDTEFNKYLEYAQKSDLADVSTSKSGWKAYQEGKFDSYVSEYKEMLKQYDVSDSEQLYDTWSKYGAQRLENTLKGKAQQKETNATLESLGVSKSEKNQQVYATKGEKGINTIKEIQSGLTPNKQKKYATADVIPVLENMNMNDADKGYYLKNASGYSLSNKAEEFYDAGNYADVWYYYELKNLLDTNHNGSLTKAEKSKIKNYTSVYGDDILDWF